MIKNLILIAIGGATGSVLRYMTSVITGKFFAAAFPLATFLVNIAGCFIIGIFAGLYYKNNLSNPDLKLFLLTGFCGGFTTFSAFAHENISLIQSNNISMAIVYTALSVIAGLTFVWLGLLVTK